MKHCMFTVLHVIIPLGGLDRVLLQSPWKLMVK